MSNYPEHWDRERIRIWEQDLDLIAEIMGKYCRMSLEGKRKMAKILQQNVAYLNQDELDEAAKNNSPDPGGK